MTNKELKSEIKEALTVAKDFFYPEEVKEKLKKCESVEQISNVLADARHKYL